MTIYLEDMGKVTFPFEPEEQIKKLSTFRCVRLSS